MAADAGASWGRNDRLAALTVALAVTVSVFDGVMINATLPTIAARLDAEPAEAIWVVNAYQLAAALVLLPLGKAADIYGHKRIYLGSIALFGAASLGSALAPDLPTLAACRFVQGCGGAGIMGITNAMLRFVYPPERFGRGVALNSMLVAMALAAGPPLASLVASLVSWRLLFVFNLPIVVLLLAIGYRVLPTGRRDAHRYDAVSALLSMATFGLILLSVDTGSHTGDVILPAALAAGGLVTGALLLRRQRGVAQPLLPVDLLRIRLFGMSVATLFAASAAQLIAYVVLPFLFQHDLGLTQVETGLLFLPWPVALAAAAGFSGRLGDRVEIGWFCALGLAIFAAGLVLLAMLEPGASFADIGWRMALCGLGYGLFQPPSSRTLLNAAPLARLGSASVMGATARVMGQATGAALAALLFRLMPADGRTAALYAAAALAALGVLLSLSRGPQPLTARSTG